MFEKILFPVDLRETSQAQLDCARLFTQTQRAELTALYVSSAETNLYDISTLSSLKKDWDQVAREKLRALAGHDIERQFLEGEPIDTICQLAEKENFDLVLIPARNFESPEQFFVGSVAQGLLSSLTVPVLVLPPAYLKVERSSPFTPRWILCAVDLKAGTEAVLEMGLGLANQFSARLAVLHSVSLPDEILQMVTPSIFSRLKAEIRRRILARYFQATRADEVLIDKGSPYRQILKHAEEEAIDLLVLGFPNTVPTPSTSTVLRTVAQGKVPVLCVPVD